MRLLLVLALVLAAGRACAQASVGGPPGGRTTGAAAAVRPAPAAQAVTVPPATPRIRAYNREWYTLYFAATAWYWLGLLLALRLRLGPALRDLADRWSDRLALRQGWAARPLRWPAGRRLTRAALVYALFSLVVLLWNLPPGLAGYAVERAYGFATLGAGRWLLDRGIGYAFGLANILAVWWGYWLLERSPARWWLWLWLASIPWTLLSVVIYPVVIAPAYNHFEPLRDPALRRDLLALADRAGIRGARVYQVDSSSRTTKLNAYVAGLGPTRRIVLWDTTIRALPREQTVAIVGHEMGHYVLHHVWWNFLGGVAAALVFLWLLARILPWAVRRFGATLGLRAVHDLAGLPLVMLLLSLLTFAQTPIESAISRYEEHQADRYGLELTHLNEATARAFAAFVRRDYADPDPPAFIVLWLYSHPPIRERVQFALGHHPWLDRAPDR